MKFRSWIVVWLFLQLFVFHTAFAQGFRFTSSARATNGLLLNWTNADAGQNYTVQSRDRLTNSIWLTLPANQPWPIIQTQWLDATSSNQSMRFYRVVAVPSATRGKLLSSNLVKTYTIAALNNIFASNSIPATAQYAVNFYKIVYETLDPLGGRVQASGGLFLPQNVGQALPLFSFQHPSVTQSNKAPSTTNSNVLPVGLLFAAAGYAAALPDYLGLGDGSGYHPFLHARSEATAGVDMLRASRRYCASNSIALTNQLFLAGYSEGGLATLALQRELENYHTNEFSITANAPMDGPYDMSGVILSNALLYPGCPPRPYYLAAILTTYQWLYSLAPAWSNLLVSPYDTTIPPLFNGQYGSTYISSNLPACNVSSILTTAFLTSLQNDPDCPFRQALRDNDVDQWRPVAPLRLYHCAADADVPYADSQVAYSNFLARGASQVQLIDPMPSADHDGCALPSVLAAKTWFDSLKH